jgi:hypothetical protein
MFVPDWTPKGTYEAYEAANSELASWFAAHLRNAVESGYIVHPLTYSSFLARAWMIREGEYYAWLNRPRAA